MLSFRDNPHVVPAPRTNNRNEANDILNVPPAQRRGLSTSPLFADDAQMKVDAPAAIGITPGGEPINDAEVRNRDIPDVIAHPQISHFFNTELR